MPLVSFLGSIARPQQYIPDGFLTHFEMERLNLDKYGALVRINDKQMQMMIGNYILIKVLVIKILSNPGGLGFLPEDQK
jgi:hypothetical protein